MNHLRLSGTSDDGDSIELFVEVETEGFVGTSQAWFSPEEIADFASELAVYPLPSGTSPSLAFGYRSCTSPNSLKTEIVLISVSQINAQGKLGVLVSLSAPNWRPGSGNAVQVELITNYQDMQVFAKDLHRFANGEYTEVTLSFREGSGA